MVANLLAIGVLQAIHARGNVGRRRAADGDEARRPGSSSALVRGAAGRRRGHAADRGERARSPRSSRRSSRAAARRRGPRRGGRIEDAAVLVRVLGGAPTEDDERELRAAKRASVPVVAVQTGTEVSTFPYVLATDVVVCRPGEGFPVDEIAAARGGAARRGRHARSPRGCRCCASRSCERADRRASRGRTGSSASRSSCPAPTSPVLTLNQLRLVLRLAAAHGVEVDQSRAARGARRRRRRVRLPRRRAAGARRRPGRGLGRQGRRSPTPARARSARRRTATSHRAAEAELAL